MYTTAYHESLPAHPIGLLNTSTKKSRSRLTYVSSVYTAENLEEDDEGEGEEEVDSCQR